MKKIWVKLLFGISGISSYIGLGKSWKMKLGIVLCGIMAGMSSCKSHQSSCYSVQQLDTNRVVEPTCYQMPMDTNIVDPPTPINNIQNTEAH